MGSWTPAPQKKKIPQHRPFFPHPTYFPRQHHESFNNYFSSRFGGNLRWNIAVNIIRIQSTDTCMKRCGPTFKSVLVALMQVFFSHQMLVVFFWGNYLADVWSQTKKQLDFARALFLGVPKKRGFIKLRKLIFGHCGRFTSMQVRYFDVWSFTEQVGAVFEFSLSRSFVPQHDVFNP